MNAVESDTDTLPAYVPRVSLSDYEYELPEERIATHPMPDRARSRLLVCRVGADTVHHRRFDSIVELIPPGAMLVLNDTRVVRARLVLHKQTGGRVEFMLLEPLDPSRDPAVTLATTRETVWICMIGGAKKLRGSNQVTTVIGSGVGAIELSAIVEERLEEGFRVRFRWTPATLSFAELLEHAGRMPLPPYIKREVTDEDLSTYQTVYAEREGAVAAPTAGLHFTDAVLGELERRRVAIRRVTLHVGAGTFKQVEGDMVHAHRMHRERISVSGDTLRTLSDHARRREHGGHPFVIVGTTSLRTLESLYWFGARLLLDGDNPIEMNLEQWDPYRLTDEHPVLPSVSEALDRVEEWRADLGVEAVTGRTGLLIVPGYEFKACDALITNFHQPGSTLILLVGAMMGRRLWRRAYHEALTEGYRFLSYGDASLIVLDDERMSCRSDP